MKAFIKTVNRVAGEVDDILLDIFGVGGKALFVKSGETPKYIRLPQNEPRRNEIYAWIKSVDPQAETVNDIPIACKVDPSLNWASHIRYYLGDLHLQTLSSMLPPMILEPRPHETVLDIAAAPGSKTSEIADMMENTGRLVANDSSRPRLAALISNLDRWSVHNTAITNRRGEQLGNLLPEYFDRVLVDAPCSSIGAPKKWKDVQNWLKPRNIKNLVETQAKLLLSAVKATKTGGTIVYSTCTLNPLENEALVDWALHHLPLELIPIEQTFSLKKSQPLLNWRGMEFDHRISGTFKISPLENETEGFFIAKFRKKTDQSDKTAQLNSFIPAQKNILLSFFDHYGIDKDIRNKFALQAHNGKIWLLSREWEEGMIPFAVKTGLKIAQTRKEGEWRFTPGGSQLLGTQTKQRKIVLDDSSWKELMGTGKVVSNLEDGYYLLFWQERPVTYGLVEYGKLKIKIGRPFIFFI